MTENPADPLAMIAAQLGPEAMSGARLAIANGRLSVAFIHPYLRTFWLKRHQADLEAAGRHFLGHDLQFDYEDGCDIASGDAPDLAPAGDCFSDFIAAGNNVAAVHGARALCDPSDELSLLLLTGPSGSGKSALLLAMARALTRRLGRRAVLMCPSGILPDGDLAPRALLADDIHLLQSADQKRLANFLDKATANGGIVALTCSGKNAEWVGTFDARLARRLDVFLHLELEPPDLAVRIKWLEKQNQSRQLGLSNVQIASLCRLERHISRLEGLLQKFVFYSRMENRTWAWDELEKMAPPEQAQPWLRIFSLVAARLNVPEADIGGASRRREIVLARQVAMYLARQTLGLSYPELGRIFGNRDHATVIHSIRKIEQLRQVDKDMHNLLTDLAAKLF